MEATETLLQEESPAMRAAHGKKGTHRAVEDDLRSAQSRFEMKPLLIEHMLVALQIAGQHSENLARMKLSKRDIWDLYEENQGRMLIIIGTLHRL